MLEFHVSARLDAFVMDAEARLPMPGVTALFGPSGAGKSSLLRAIAGFVRGQGRIQFRDETWLSDTRFVPPHKRPVGYVFQDMRLFSHLNVAGNLSYAQRRGSSAAPPLDDVVDALDLSSLLARGVANLSGGEQRRVALARTLLTGAQLLLLDEPLVGLDGARKREVMGYIGGLSDRFDVRLLLVTHAVDEVVALANDMVVMEAGRILRQGETEQVLQRLDVQAMAGQFEAGAMVTARLDSEDTAQHITHLEIAGQHLTLPELIGAAPGASVRLHVRARDVAIATGPVTGISIRNQLRGNLVDLQATPDTAYVEAVVDLGGQQLRARITHAAVADLALRVGQPVYALVKSASLA